jgi:phage-related protein
MKWVVETYGPVVDAEILALPADMQGKLIGLLPRIAELGLSALPRDAVKHLEDKLWELRITGRDGIARAIYITVTGRKVVILRAFQKKTQKTPLNDLETARRTAKDIIQRRGPSCDRKSSPTPRFRPSCSNPSGSCPSKSPRRAPCPA